MQYLTLKFIQCFSCSVIIIISLSFDVKGTTGIEYIVLLDAQLNDAPEHCLSIKPGLVPDIHSQRNSKLIGNMEMETQQTTDNCLLLSTMQLLSREREKAT